MEQQTKKQTAEVNLQILKEGKWVVCDAYRNREITDCSKYLMKNLVG